MYSGYVAPEELARQIRAIQDSCSRALERLDDHRVEVLRNALEIAEQESTRLLRLRTKMEHNVMLKLADLEEHLTKRANHLTITEGDLNRNGTPSSIT